MKEPKIQKGPPSSASRKRTEAVRSVTKPRPGGKALARLHFFETARGFHETEVGHRLREKPPPALALARGMRARAGSARGANSPYLTAFNDLRRLSRLAPPVQIAQGWRPLGPFSIPHGQTYGSGAGSRPAISGRISAVAVDPGNANHILIGAAGGGVWETRDGGQNWRPRTDNQPSLATGAIAFDPVNPMIVYAGTGEGDFFWRLGVGLLRSIDGGTTWSLVATSPFQGVGFYDLAVDPLDGDHLFAATTHGLFESADGGVTWTARRSQRTWDLSIHPAVAGDPNSTKEVFAACADGLYRSTNGGTTWTAVALPAAPGGYGRLEVCHAPSDGDIVYAFASDGNSGYLWRRSAFGGAFAAESAVPGLAVNQSWYDWFAAVAPNNPDVLYLGAISVHKGLRSSAGTWTWTDIASRATGDSIHPDQHAIAFSPTDANVIYIGNDGGLYRSTDGGGSWSSLNKGLCITEFEYLSQHPQFEAYLIGGTQDNGTLRYEGQEVWFHVQDGDGGDCGVNSSSPYTCYHTFYDMGMERSTAGGGWGSWSWIGPNVPGGYSALFYPPVEANGNILAQAGQSLFVSTDSGTSWTEVALPTGAGVGSALAIPSNARVYVGTSAGRIYRTDLTGSAWGAAVALTQPRTGYVSDLAVDPTNPNRLWATYSDLTGGHVYRSDNGGTSWSNVSQGLPSIPVNAVVMDPANPNTAYVGADVGVYRSLDAGATWTAFNNLLPNALVHDLVFHAQSRLLRAATQSRGVWEIAVDQGTMPDVEVYLRDSVVDTGRLSPSPSGVNDPFIQGSLTHWWQCTDLKVDSPSYQRPLISDLDIDVFEDDHGVAASGLIHENVQRNRMARVFVQVHNRGVNPAINVAVRVFYADASVGLPYLPAGFWTNFPNNIVPAASPWQPIGPYKTVAGVEAGRSQIVGFEWLVPSVTANHTCLLAVLSADNDSINTAELNIGALVTGNKKCGLKNLTIVNPPPHIGPRLALLALNLWGPEKRLYSLGAEKNAGAILKALILSKSLSLQAQQAKLKSTKLSTTEQTALLRLVGKESTKLRDQLDLQRVFAVPREPIWLKGLKLSSTKPELLVVILQPKPRAGHCSIVQTDERGRAVGGYTLLVRESDS